MKHYVSFRFGGLISLIAGLLYFILIPGLSFAQSSLQNPAQNSSLQPQASATQQSANTQNQVGTLQNNNGGSVLNQSGNKPLGVVSSPNQTAPSAIVSPSSTSKAEVAKLDSKSNTPRFLLAGGALLVAIIGALALRRMAYNQNQITYTESAVIAEKPVIKPEPLPTISTKKTRKQQRRKKKKKSNQR